MRTVIQWTMNTILPPNPKADTSSSLSNPANNHKSHPKQQRQQQEFGGLFDNSHAAVVRAVSICSRTKEKEDRMMKRETTASAADDDDAARPGNDIGEFSPSPLEGCPGRRVLLLAFLASSSRPRSPSFVPPWIGRWTRTNRTHTRTPLPSFRTEAIFLTFSDFSPPPPLPPPPFPPPIESLSHLLLRE